MFGVCCLKVTMATIVGCCIGCFALFNFASPVVLYCVIFLWKVTVTTQVALSHPVFLGGGWASKLCHGVCELLCIIGSCAAQTRCCFALALLHKLAWSVAHPAAVKPQTTVTLAKKHRHLSLLLSSSPRFTAPLCAALFARLNSLWVFCFTFWPIKQPSSCRGVQKQVFVGLYFFNSGKRNSNV